MKSLIKESKQLLRRDVHVELVAAIIRANSPAGQSKKVTSTKPDDGLAAALEEVSMEDATGDAELESELLKSDDENTEKMDCSVAPSNSIASVKVEEKTEEQVSPCPEATAVATAVVTPVAKTEEKSEDSAQKATSGGTSEEKTLKATSTQPAAPAVVDVAMPAAVLDGYTLDDLTTKDLTESEVIQNRGMASSIELLNVLLGIGILSITVYFYNRFYPYTFIR